MFAAHVSRDDGGAGIPATNQRRSLRQMPVSPKANVAIQRRCLPEPLVKDRYPAVPLKLLLNAGDVAFIQDLVPDMADENVEVVERLHALSLAL